MSSSFENVNETSLALEEIEEGISKLSPLVSDEVEKIFHVSVYIFGFYATSFMGIGCNVVNIVVYWKQGLKDSISVGLFSLSMSDLMVAFLPVVAAICYSLQALRPDLPVHWTSIHYVSAAWLRNMMYSMSCLITTFLSLERCFCVVLPFKVKTVFTRKRTTIAILTAFLLHLACFIPVFATNKLEWTPSPAHNNSLFLSVTFSGNRQGIEDFNYSLMSIAMPSVAQVIVAINAFIMVNGLRATSKFRKSFVMAKEQNKEDARKDDQEVTTTKLSSSQREANLVKTVILLVIILTACNIPYLAIMYANRFIREFNIGRAYSNLYSVLSSCYYVTTSLNASVNVLVYYKISHKFRETFHNTFCCKK